jgi:multicomponent Na+:H+ antiporter subunit D
MIGIPPTGGFFSKWYLMVGGLEAGAGGLVVVLVGSGVLTAAYLFRLLERVWARPAPEAAIRPVGAEATVPIVVLGVAVVAFGLLNTWFVTRLIVPSLPGAGGGVG